MVHATTQKTHLKLQFFPHFSSLCTVAAVYMYVHTFVLSYSDGFNLLQCSLHGEPYTMFCTTKKAMLCMKCFRDTSAEARRYCVDLDTAYNQGAKKLERALTVRTTFLCIPAPVLLYNDVFGW